MALDLQCVIKTNGFAAGVEACCEQGKSRIGPYPVARGGWVACYRLTRDVINFCPFCGAKIVIVATGEPYAPVPPFRGPGPSMRLGTFR